MKPKALFLTIILSTVVSFINAQTEFFRYAIPGGDGSIIQFEVDSVGNNYIVGSYNDQFQYQDKLITGNPQSEGDLYLLKTTPSGEPIYLHSLNGTGNGDAVSLRKFIVKQSGELYIVLATNGISEFVLGKQTITLDPAQSPTILAKFSKTGFLEWTKTLFAEGAQASLTANDIAIDSEGNAFIVGDFAGNNANLDGTNIPGLESVNLIFLVKYLADGTNAWGSTCGYTTDTVGNIFANNVEISSDGTIYLSGTHNGARQFIFNKDYLQNQGTTNTYLSAFDSEGNTLWAIPFEGNGTILPSDIAIDEQNNIAFSCFFNSGGLIVNGQTYISVGNYDLLIVSVRKDKSFLWETDYFTTNLSFVSSNSGKNYIQYGKDGNLFVSGEANNGTSFIYFYSVYGGTGGVATILNTTFGVNATYDHMKIDKYGNTLIAGTTYLTFEIDGFTIVESTGYGTSYLMRINNSGEVDYVYQRPNTIDDNLSFNGIGVDNYKNLFIAGNFSGLDVNLEEHFLSEKNNSGVYLAEYGNIGSISGKVQDFYSSPITNGIVKLIGYTYLQKSPLADSVELQSDGSFEFKNVPLGKYLLLAQPGNLESGGYMETYFPATGNWEQGEHIILDESNLNFDNIFIIVPENAVFEGESRISGEITIIEEADVFKSVNKKPSAKSKASLATKGTKSDYQIIAVTESDIYGAFEFNYIEDGEYTIFIDIPGLPSVNPHSVVVSNGMFISNVNYYIDEEKVTGVDSPSGSNFPGLEPSNIVLVYPNPNQGSFKVESTNGKQIDSVTLFNIQGKIIKHFDKVQAKLTVTGLENGIYIVSALMDGENYKFKLIVNR